MRSGAHIPLLLSVLLPSSNSMFLVLRRSLHCFGGLSSTTRRMELRSLNSFENCRDIRSWKGRCHDFSGDKKFSLSRSVRWSHTHSDEEVRGDRRQRHRQQRNQSLNKDEPCKSNIVQGERRTRSQQRSSRLLLREQFLSLSPVLSDGFGLSVAVLAVALSALYFNQEKMLYLPEIEGMPRQNSLNPLGYRSPAEYDIPFEEHWIETKDGVSIHSWLLLRPESQERQIPTICFFHGNAGNIGIRLPNAKQMFDLLQCNVLMVEYRGYGDSEDAKPTESGLKLDAEAAVRFIQTHPAVDPTRVFLFGRSLGGAVSFHVAQYAEKNGIPLAGMVVENTFVSVGRMVDAIFPLLSPFQWFLLRMDWDCAKIAPTLKIPILYLAGDSDEIVPFSHMQELYESSKHASVFPRIHVVKGGTHNETWIQGGRLYWESIRKFLVDAMARA